jgi:hypothetical protein
MKSLLTALVLIGSLSFARADDICVKQLSMMMPYSGKLQFKECKYFVRDETIDKLAAFGPRTSENAPPVLKVLATAYTEYFSKHGVSSDAFYQEARISLEKVDDFTKSEIADSLRTRSAKVRNLWFYLVTYGERDFGGTQPHPAPLVILLDGTLIFANERTTQTP